ncbi:MAG: hypothetical protein ACPGJI_05340 [Kangiellaceae bacterium]
MDDKSREITGKIFIYISIFLYLTSLINLAISATKSDYYGWEVLLVGGFQTFISLLGFVNGIGELSIQTSIEYLTLALPWLANVSMIVTSLLFFCGSKFCRFFAIISIVCVGIFFTFPKAVIGNEISIVNVQPQIGAYLWALTAVLLLVATLVKKYEARSNMEI